MLVWIENAPTLEKNSEEEIVKFVDNYLTCSANDDETAHLVDFKHTNIQGPVEKRERHYVDLDFRCLLCLEQCYCIR